MGVVFGFLLALAAGASVGFSMFPLKWARVWKWENFWLFYSIFSLILMPFALAFATVPDLAGLYARLGTDAWMKPFLLGCLWGLAQLGCGVVIQKLGLGVASAVLNGVSASFGTLLPLFALHQGLTFETSGVLLLGGAVLMSAGAVFSGRGGYLRENELRASELRGGFAKQESAMRQVSLSTGNYVVTLALAVLAGILAALLNVALAYGDEIMRQARNQGAASAWAPFAVWPIALAGGSLTNIAYSVYLLTKNRTWGGFGSFGREIGNPFLAAAMWMGGIALYSSGTTFLGTLGISIGFGVYTISMILSAQAAGLLTGEWRANSGPVRRAFACGVALLLAAAIMIGASRFFTA